MTVRASAGRPQLFVDAVEDPVDEAARLLGAELLGDLKRFARLYAELDATTATGAKVAALRRYFAEVGAARVI